MLSGECVQIRNGLQTLSENTTDVEQIKVRHTRMIQSWGMKEQRWLMYSYVMLPFIDSTPQIHKAAVFFIKHPSKSASKSETLQTKWQKRAIF